MVTRAVYDPKLWPTDANQRRLSITNAVTVRSLASQTRRDFEWWVAVHPDDQILEARQEVFSRAGVPVVWRPVRPNHHNRSKQAMIAYHALGPFQGPTLSTRLDDDDAFAADVFARLREVVAESDPETAFLFPTGHRVWGGRYTDVRYESNAMSSLWSPRGRSVVSYLHRQVRTRVRQFRFVDEAPAWLWVRHPDTLSTWKVAYHPLTDEIRRLYPVDWTVLDAQPLVEATAPQHGLRDWVR